MGERPWFKFYPSDWRADKSLRLCGAAARGLWIEMLCIMHEAKPYGHLLVNGRPVTDTQLASLSGFPQDQVTELLTELENWGVFSKNAKGVLYSRRMTRDAAKAKKCSEAGKKGGGNPTLTTTFETTFKGQDEGAFDPEARVQKPDITKDSKKVVSQTLAASERKDVPRAQRKAIWQQKICNYGARIMPDTKYQEWLVAYMDGDEWAVAHAEKLNNGMRAEEQQRKRA